jgi:hypothetical protein
MIHRFATLEQAALFALMKRDQGYFAEILHLNTGHLWGPLAMHGFPVMVSEFAADENEQVPELRAATSTGLDELRAILASATVGIVSIFLVRLAYHLLHLVIVYPLETLAWTVKFMILTIPLVVFFSVFIGGLVRCTHIYWNPQHRLYGLVKALHSVLVWLFIVLRPL